ncbi:MAG: hypothetical protein IT584_01875, partial [Chlamydiae bacterium]|nr:hypothetical protein [Chlamydiota bacterium]
NALSALIALLSDPNADAFARVVAAGALGEISKAGGSLPENALSGLIALLSDPNADAFAREAAAGALGEFARAETIHSKNDIELIYKISGIAFYEFHGEYYIADERKVHPFNKQRFL